MKNQESTEFQKFMAAAGDEIKQVLEKHKMHGAFLLVNQEGACIGVVMPRNPRLLLDMVEGSQKLAETVLHRTSIMAEEAISEMLSVSDAFQNIDETKVH